MFLKQGTFNYEKQSVVLSELSGLQRIEYLAFVQQRTAKFDAEEENCRRLNDRLLFCGWGWISMPGWFPAHCGMRNSLRMLRRFAHPLLQHGRMMPWSGAEMVLSLSGMGVIENAGDLEHEVLTPEKS